MTQWGRPADAGASRVYCGRGREASCWSRCAPIFLGRQLRRAIGSHRSLGSCVQPWHRPGCFVGIAQSPAPRSACALAGDLALGPHAHALPSCPDGCCCRRCPRRRAGTSTAPRAGVAVSRGGNPCSRAQGSRIPTSPRRRGVVPLPSCFVRAVPRLPPRVAAGAPSPGLRSTPGAREETGPGGRTRGRPDDSQAEGRPRVDLVHMFSSVLRPHVVCVSF